MTHPAIPGTVLSIWAHPDDEAYLAGGLMARAVDDGDRVVCVTATRGEHGTADPVAWPPARLAGLREHELAASLAALGVDEHIFLDLEDGTLDLQNEASQVARLVEIMDRTRPTTIVTFGPDGYTGHPDHRAISRWTTAAQRRAAPHARLLHATCTDERARQSQDVHDRFDIFLDPDLPMRTPASQVAVELSLDDHETDRKLAALRAQASQTAGLVAALGEDRFRAWISVESFTDAGSGHADQPAEPAVVVSPAPTSRQQRRPRQHSDETPLATRAVTRAFDGDRAVAGVDLDVHAGEIHAVIGLNGAGKSTFMRLLLGMLRPDAGHARVFGHEATAVPADLWRRVGHLVEAPFAYPELTVRRNLAASGLLHGIDHAALDELVDDAIDRFELGRWATRRAGHLSLGNRQRLGLASALIHQPDVIVLDEPANGLDPAGVVFTRDLLRTARARGAAVLVSSHQLDELARIADRISVMHRGRQIGTLSPGTPELERQFFDLIRDADLSREEVPQ